jgi:hypothetical protein
MLPNSACNNKAKLNRNVTLHDLKIKEDGGQVATAVVSSSEILGLTRDPDAKFSVVLHCLARADQPNSVIVPSIFPLQSLSTYFPVHVIPLSDTM